MNAAPEGEEDLADQMDRLVYDLLDAESAEAVRARIETDAAWRAAYEAAVERRRALAAEIDTEAEHAPPPSVEAVMAAADNADGAATRPDVAKADVPGRGAWRFWTLAAAILLLNAGGLIWIRHSLRVRRDDAPAKLRVVQVLPAGYADRTDRLSLVFAQDLAAADQVGKPLRQPLFHIDPAPPGRWVWADRNRLDYVLTRPLPPGRQYTVRADDDIEVRTGRVLLGEKVFRFQTRPLALAQCRLHTADRTHVNFELTFNQVVDPKEVLRHLKVYDGAVPPHRRGGVAPPGMQVRALTSRPAQRVVLRTRRPHTGKLRIILDGELRGVGGELGLGRSVVHVLSASPAFTLLGADVPTAQFEKRITVELPFSAELDRKQAVPKVNVRPAVADLKVSRSGRTLYLAGSFACGRRYAVTVPATVLAHDGRTLGEDKTTHFEVPDRRAGVRIPLRRGVLMPDGNLCVDVQAVNVAGFEIAAWRVHANQLLPHLRGEDIDATARRLAHKTVRLDLPRNAPTTMAVDLEELLGEPRGIYRIELDAIGRPWLHSSAVVTVSDLALTTKRQSDGLLVWVTSLRTGRPVGGAVVAALSLTNQELARGRTDAEGLARLAVAPNHPDGGVHVVTARLGDDLSYLVPADRQWMIDDVDQSGAPLPGTYDVMLYTERGVYRPGDTVHVTGIIRDRLGRMPRSFPLVVQVVRPDGRAVADLPATPPKDGQGVFHVDYPTHEYDRTGAYRFRCLLPGGDEVLGRTAAYVEAFIPLRMRVKLKPEADWFGPDDKPHVEISARYLWDQAAGGLPVTVSCLYARTAFRSDKYRDYTFGDGTRRSWDADDVRARLDADGRTHVELPTPGAREPKALWRVSVSATVTETGGRSVSANDTIVVDRVDRHVGLRLSPRRVVSTAGTLRVDWVRRTGRDRPAPPGAMQLTLSRVEHDWVLKDVDGRTVWQSRERVIPVEQRKIAAGEAEGTLALKCDRPGTHRVEIRDLDTGSTTRAEVYASHGSAGRETLPMNRPERLEVLLDRKQYTPGSKARVVVRSPLSGTALVTLETDRVLAHRIVSVAKNSAEVTFDVPRTVRGGAFVTATVVRAIDPSRKKWLPHRAMGMARLKTTHRSQRLALKIEAPKQARPGARVTVAVDAGSCQDPARPGVVHLWAVDEGILLTTAYLTPDPLTHFFAPRGLGVRTSDLFGRLLPDHRRAASIDRIGAGGDEPPGLGALRRNPVATKRREAAVVWRAAVPLEPDGRASAQLRMPELVGRMRIMAVAVDHDRYGSAEHAVVLTTPLLVEASWPRFAAPGDRFDVPVKLFNATDRPVAVALNVHADGPVEIDPAQGAGRIVVAPRRPAVHWLSVRATAMGPVEVRVEARPTSAADEALRSVAKAAFAVRPAGALHAAADVRRIDAGRDLVLPAPDAFVPGTCTRTLHVGGKPTVELTPAVEKLLRYPYGCLEQTTSSLYPLLYAPDLIGQQVGEDARIQHVIDMVHGGIGRLWAMQTRSGGLAYWPGSNQSCLWGTAYAAAFLLDAKAAGYRVDPRFLRELVRYLDRMLVERQLDANMRALICRVLATFGRLRRGWMARLAERPDHLDIAGRAHLAGAYIAIGRKDLARKTLGDNTLALEVTPTSGGRITSRTRQLAVLLGVLLDLDADHAWIPAVVRQLESARKNGCWSNTLENASAVAALSRYQMLTAGQADFEGEVQPPQGKAVRFDHKKPAVVEIKDDGPVQIATRGKGSVYVTAVSRGLMRAELIRPYDRNLIVRRTWLDRRGRPIDPAKLRVGDLVHVRVTLRVPEKASVKSVQNVAIVDALPGGMEVENPRLVSSSAVASAVPPSGRRIPATPHAPAGPVEELVPTPTPSTPPQRVNEADRVEFLDDRVVLFSSASQELRVFYYALRVTTAGEFVVPAVQASCMYADTIASLGEPGRAVVER